MVLIMRFFRSFFVLAFVVFLLGCQDTKKTPKHVNSQGEHGAQFSILSFTRDAHIPVPRVFNQQDARYQEFQRLYLDRPEEALKQWLLGTERFSRLSDGSELHVERIPTPYAWVNGGVYRVSVGHPSQGGEGSGESYILKIAPNQSRQELYNLWWVEKALRSQVEYLRSHASQIHFRGSLDDAVIALPKFPHLYEYASFDIPAREGEPAQELLAFVMDKVKGQGLHELNDVSHDTLTYYHALGRGLGYLHAMTAVNPESPFEEWIAFSHNDAHWGNIFVDPADARVSLIDLDRISVSNQFKNDIFLSLFPQLRGNLFNGFEYTINLGLQRFQQSSPELIPVAMNGWAENVRTHMADQGLSDLSLELVGGLEQWRRYGYLINFLNHDQSISIVRESRSFQVLSHLSDRVLSMTEGYLEAIPQDRQHEVKAFYSKLCHESVNDFLRQFSISFILWRNPNFIEPHLRESFRRVFPDSLNRCLDANF